PASRVRRNPSVKDLLPAPCPTDWPATPSPLIAPRRVHNLPTNTDRGVTTVHQPTGQSVPRSKVSSASLLRDSGWRNFRWLVVQRCQPQPRERGWSQLETPSRQDL